MYYINPENKILHNVLLSQIAKLKIKYGEVDLARKVKYMEEKWNKAKKVWELAYSYLHSLQPIYLN